MAFHFLDQVTFPGVLVSGRNPSLPKDGALSTQLASVIWLTCSSIEGRARSRNRWKEWHVLEMQKLRSHTYPSVVILV